MQRSQKIFVFNVVLIHLAYFIGSLFFKTYLNNDSYEYINQANNLIHHGSFYAAQWSQLPHLPEYYSLRPPLYSIFILITMYVTNSAYVLLFFQSLLSVFSWLLLRRYILKFIPHTSEGRLSVYLILALVLNPVQLVLCNSVFSDILFQSLLTLAFFSFLEGVAGHRSKFFFYYTLFLTLALLTKPALMYFAYLNILVAIFVFFRISRKGGILACALIMPLVLFCVSANNYKNTGYYHYNSSKVFNVWAYNTTNFLNMKYGNDSGYVYKNEIYRLSLSQPDFKRQYEFVDSACTHVLISNITSYSMFHAQGVVNFFLAPGREFVNGYMGIPDSQPKSFIKELNVNGLNGIKSYVSDQPLALFAINVLTTLWNAMLFVGLVVFAFSKRVPLNIKLLALIIVFYIAGVSSLAIGTARYKTAIYPILLFCNAWIIHKKPAKLNK